MLLPWCVLTDFRIPYPSKKVSPPAFGQSPLSFCLFTPQGFHRILLRRYGRGNQSRNGGQNHADDNQRNAADPGQLRQIGYIRQMLDDDVGGDADQQGHADADGTCREADEKRL